MADILPDRIIDMKDIVLAVKNFGKTGTYSTDLPGVTVTFNTGEALSPDSDGFVTMPQDATSFTVKRNGNAIGAMIISYGPSRPPIAYSTTFDFTVPAYTGGDVGKEVWYYILARLYVPPELSGQNFYFVATADYSVQNVKINGYLKAGSGSSVNIDLGKLGGGYHLLEFEFVDVSGGGSLNFHVATGASQYAWLSRFRIYVPNYSDTTYEYSIVTNTWLPGSDDYFLKGFADDYIDNVRLGVGELYNDWQWDMGNYGKIYAWPDGFRYPLGYFSEQQDCWKIVEFKFGNEKDGLLDFQYLSYSNQKDRIGLPELYGWCNAQVTDPGHTLDWPYPVSFGNTSIYERKYYVGSCWTNSSAPGLSKRFISTSQEMQIYDNTAGSYARLRLGFGIGWAIPKFSETAQFGAMINLTHMGLAGHSPYEIIRLEGVKLDIYTPQQSVSISGLVYRDPNDPSSDNIVELGGKIAVGATARIINWQASALYASGVVGPYGIAIALIGTTAGEAIYNYVVDHQQENFGESPGGNSTHRQIWYDQMFQMSDFNINPQQSKSHIVFIGLDKQLPKSCGAMKLVLSGEITLYHIIATKTVKAKAAFEMGIVIPIFAW